MSAGDFRLDVDRLVVDKLVVDRLGVDRLVVDRLVVDRLGVDNRRGRENGWQKMKRETFRIIFDLKVPTCVQALNR